MIFGVLRKFQAYEHPAMSELEFTWLNAEE